MTMEMAAVDQAATKTTPSPSAFRRAVRAERLMYGAGGVLAAVGPQMDNVWANGGAVAAGAGTVMWLWHRTKDEDGSGLLVSCQRALPLLTWSGTYTASLVGPGTSWWEYVAPVAWTALMGMWAPLVRSRGLKRAIASPVHIPAQAAAPFKAVSVDPYVGGLETMWANSSATGDTSLVNIHQYRPDQMDFEAVILAPAGQAVPKTLDTRTVAAVFDVPETAVKLSPVDGRGPGQALLQVTPSAPSADVQSGLEGLWTTKVSGPKGAAPGMALAAYRASDDRVVMRVEAAEGQIISLPRIKVARALGVDDPNLVMVETDGMATGVVTVYREHPLLSIREATIDDLRMGPDGQITIGLRHDGRPARMPLYDPELGALTDLAVGAMGSGKSVFLNTILAAERISGVVSIVADAQNGMSLPEAKGRVAHFGAGIAAVGATLAAACAVADYREVISAENGWGGFKIGEPWRLANITIDEINLILGEQAQVPAEFRKWVTGMIARFQSTGRKFGWGIRFAGQSIHVADLGEAEKIRANAKNGTVWLGRVNSSQTKSMATDMVNDGTEITPIPKHFGSVSGDVEAAWNGEEAPRGPVTAGMAWLIQGGRSYLMRVFKAIKEDRAFPGLIALYESAPIPYLSPAEAEIFERAYAEALDAAERFLAGEDADSDDDEEEGEPRRKRKGPAGPTIHAPKSLRDKILDALADGQPHRSREIRAAVGVGTADGPVSGSVDNTLSKLRDEGVIAQAGHGIYQLPN